MTTHTISNKKDAIGLQPKTFGNYAAGFILCLILKFPKARPREIRTIGSARLTKILRGFSMYVGIF